MQSRLVAPRNSPRRAAPQTGALNAFTLAAWAEWLASDRYLRFELALARAASCIRGVDPGIPMLLDRSKELRCRKEPLAAAELRAWQDRRPARQASHA